MNTLAILLSLLPLQEDEWPSATLLGASVSAAGDVDGDGVEDYAAGAPLAHDGESQPGALVVFSGATNESLRVVFGARHRGWFGTRVASAGDLDGDGAAELLVGGGDGVSLISGANGEVAWHIEASLAHSGPLGDLDGDGVSELFFGDGRTGRAVSVGGEEVATRLNVAKRLRYVGDVDGDGFAEMARLHREDPPRVEILAGPTWRSREQLTLPVEWEEDLRAMRFALADLDGDGTRDYVIATPRWRAAGAVFAFSGEGGAPLWWRRGEDQKLEEYGTSLLPMGDVDGDGREDVAVGAPSWINSRVAVLSGDGGKELWAVTGRANPYATDEIGTDLALLADRDGDGVPELLAGGGCHTAHGVWCPTGNLRVLSGASGEELAVLAEDALPELRGK